MKRTSHQYLKYAEEKEILQEYKEFKHQMFNMRCERLGVKHPVRSLLDSSLITTTDKRTYYFKIVDCGKYKQVYYYNQLKIKKDKNLEGIKKYEDIDTTYLFKKENLVRKNEKKYIEYKNINRSKFNLERLIKANEDVFKSFITLTFDEEVIDIEVANKRFRYWRDLFQRNKKDFKYVCVPEFQKNGRVHYHLLTNVSYNDLQYINENEYLEKLKNKIKKIKLYKINFNKYKINNYKMNDFKVCLRYQENRLQNTKKTYNYKTKSYKVFKTIKYWNNGYSNVIDIKNINVVGYMSKYMTKEIDNRLYGRRRYLYSLSLITPREYYIDCKNDNEFLYYLDIINNCDKVYKSTYVDKQGDEIDFIEFKDPR